MGKRLAKSPKLYFTDSGLAAFLNGYGSADALWSSPQVGALFENYVVSQWQRWKDASEPSATLWYWRDQAGHEADLVIERNGRLYAIECKATETPRRRDARGLGKLVAFYGEERVARRYVASTSRLPVEIADGVTAMPGWTTWDLDDRGGVGRPGVGS